VDKARMLNGPMETILEKLEDANVTTPAGNVKSGTMEIPMRTLGTFTNLDQLRDLFLMTAADGSPVRIKDIAEVRDTYEEITRYVRVNGKPGIFIQIYKQSGANTVAVAKEVKKEIERINKDMSNEFHIVAVSDSSKYIQRSINNVADSAITGGLLAIVILFLFLCNIRRGFLPDSKCFRICLTDDLRLTVMAPMDRILHKALCLLRGKRKFLLIFCLQSLCSLLGVVCLAIHIIDLILPVFDHLHNRLKQDLLEHDKKGNSIGQSKQRRPGIDTQKRFKSHIPAPFVALS
jgi:hypothetical protein